MFGRKNTKCHLSLSLFFLQEQAVKSWDLPSEELVAYRYENVCFFLQNWLLILVCQKHIQLYIVTTVIGVKSKISRDITRAHGF